MVPVVAPRLDQDPRGRLARSRADAADAHGAQKALPRARAAAPGDRSIGRIAATRPPGRTARAATSTHSARRSAISLKASARSGFGDGGLDSTVRYGGLVMTRSNDACARAARRDRARHRRRSRAARPTRSRRGRAPPAPPAAAGSRRQPRSPPDRAPAAGMKAGPSPQPMSRNRPYGGATNPASSTGSRLMRAPRAGWKMRTRPLRSVSAVTPSSSTLTAPATYLGAAPSRPYMTSPVASLGWK